MDEIIEKLGQLTGHTWNDIAKFFAVLLVYSVIEYFIGIRGKKTGGAASIWELLAVLVVTIILLVIARIKKRRE